MSWKSMIVEKVQVKTPCREFFMKGNTLPDLKGVYILSHTIDQGYPVYNHKKGTLTVEYDKRDRYHWYWSNSTGQKVQMTHTQPPPYTPAGWGEKDGWVVVGTETIVLSPLSKYTVLPL